MTEEVKKSRRKFLTTGAAAIAGGAAAHSDHGRCVAEVFMSAARQENEAYKIKDTFKLSGWIIILPGLISL